MMGAAARAAAAIDPEREGWVYYALAATPHEQRVKIGFATSVRARMHALKADSIAPGGQVPTVLAVEPGTLALESERHKQFGQLRIGKAEWFRYEETLRLHLCQMNPRDIERAFWPATHLASLVGAHDF